MESSILTLMIFFPLAGMVTVFCLPSQAKDLIRWTAFAFTLPALFLGIWLYQNFDTTTPALQFVVNVPWIESFNIRYFVGVDGISISMILLTAGSVPYLHSRFVEYRAGREGLFRPFPAVGYRHDGCFLRHGLLPVFYLLGVDAAADVFPDWHLGWAAA